MSILADRKRKQKWSILEGNINKNNDWSKDSNKFGQKLLEKMGWTEGKGLGKNEDGETSHVKVALKNNMKGMGFKDSVEWSVQQDNFHELLNELNNDRAGHDKPTQSLEQKSQRSRARLHYRKFTRGKDLSRCSEKDLANIFGKKKLNGEEKRADERAEREEETSGMLKVAGSMVDYFKNKSFKLGSRAGSYVDEAKSGEEVEKPRKAKKRKGGDQEASESFSRKIESIEASEALETPSKKLKFEESPLKSVRKGKLRHEGLGVANPAFEPLGVNVPIEKHALETIDECENEELNDCAPKQKRKKKKSLEDLKVEENHNHEVPVKKTKRKKPEGVLHETENSYEFENGAKPKKYKAAESNESKTPKKKQSGGFDNPVAELDDSAVENPVEATPNAFEVKRKKKKPKGLDNPALNNSRGLDNPALGLNDRENGMDNPALNLSEEENCTPKPKSKKKKRGIENPALDLDDSVQTLGTPNNFEVKRKKKKRKGEQDEDLDEASKVEAKKKGKKVVEQLQESVEQPEDDCGLILNIVEERVKEMKQDHKRSAEDIRKRNELFEINDKVIRSGFKRKPKRGIDNQAFNRVAQDVEESVSKLASTLDSYQAEVENGINESKDRRTDQSSEQPAEEILIGEAGSTGQDEGVRLSFKTASFNKKQPAWVSRNDVGSSFAKKSYRHLIKGDVILKFKNTNLDAIVGYGKA